MAQRINIQLGVQADVNQARSQIQQLQKDLSALTQVKFQDGSLIPGLDPKSLGEANVQITQLKNALNGAFNAKTGKLDLGQFQASLQKSNLDINTLKATFQSLGPAGTTAFADLAKAVASAEAPVLRVGDGIRKFMTTFANSARYMVATRALNTFVGSIQNALNYAQDLNKSLNNIAIVTGASTDKMAEFAAQANKAAQRLSVTTTGYTDAALIYYQQGLSDQEVAARTETTMKMSNVTGESAEEVSSYMTAIWNNFYDGSQSIEEFADKITALGAATASSSQEIANGLQQFAAVANTVGLSYDYAATALATIVAQTRQSESTVGNGLRTLFSRMQGLKLDGETEDGVTLNKYSQALADVGVNALDASGQLRDMDDILSDLGSKWETLSKAQQVALAQTVGGVRQYTTLVALMDNWGKFQENLTVAQGAEGTLQRQQEIYERSWEASSKRVKAAAQSIYQDIIDDKFFISLNDLFAGFLKTIDQVIKGLGGVKGVLSAVSAIAFTLFNGQIANKVDRFVISLSNLYHPENIDKLKQEYLGAFKDFVGNTGNEVLDKMTSNYATNALNSELELKSKILALSKNLSQENQEIANNIYKQVEAAQDLVIVESKALQETERQGSGKVTTGIQVSALEKALTNKQVRESLDASFLDVDINAASLREAKTFLKQNNTMNAFINSVDSMVSGVSADNLKEVQQTLLGIQETTKDDIRVTEDFRKIWGEMASAKGPEEMRGKLEELNNYIIETFGEQDGGSLKNGLANLIEGIPVEALTGKTKKAIEQLQNEVSQNTKQAQAVAAAEIEKVSGNAAIKTFGDNVDTFGQKVSNFARNASSMAMQINGIRGAFAALTSKDLEPWERITRILFSLGTLMGPNGILGKGFIAGASEWEKRRKPFTDAKKEVENAQKDYNEKNENKTKAEERLNNAQRNVEKTKSEADKAEQELDTLLNKETPTEDDVAYLKHVEELENADEKLRKAEEERTKAQKEQTRAQQAATTATQEAEEADKNLGKAKENLGKVSKTVTGKIKDFGASVLSGISAQLTSMAVMAAMTLAIEGLKAAYDAWYAATVDGRLEESTKILEGYGSAIDGVREKFEKTSSSIEQLPEIFNNIDAAKKKLDNWNPSSSEYMQTVLQTNIETQKMFEEMGLSSSKLSVDMHGLLTFDEKEIEKNLNEKLESIQLQNIQLNIGREEAKEQRVLLEVEKDTGISASESKDMVSDAIKQLADTNANQTQVRTLEGVAERLEGLNSKEDIITALNELGLSNTALGQALLNSDDAVGLLNHLGTIEEIIAKPGSDIHYQQMAQKYAQKYGYDISQMSDEEQVKLGKQLNEQFKQATDWSLFGAEKSTTTNWVGEQGYSQEITIEHSLQDYLNASQEGRINQLKDSNISSSLLDVMGTLAENGSAIFTKDSTTGYIRYGDKEINKDNIVDFASEIANVLADEITALAPTLLMKKGNEEKIVSDTFSNVNKENTFESSKDWVSGTRIQAEETLNLNGKDPEAQKALDIFNEQIQNEVENLKQLEEYTGYSDEALEVLALDTAVASEAFEELSQNAESWFKKIEKGGSSGAKALQSLSDCLLKVTGLSDDFANAGIDIDKEFADYIDRNRETAKAAANGDLDAIKELHNAAGRLAFDKVAGSNVEGISDEDRQALIGEFTTLQEDIQAELDKGIKIGSEVTVDPQFYNRLNAIVSSSASTIEQANAILGSLNLDAGDFDLIEETMPASNKFSLKVGGKEIFSGEYEASATVYHPVPKGSAKEYAKSKAGGQSKYISKDTNDAQAATNTTAFNNEVAKLNSMAGMSSQDRQTATNALAKQYGMVVNEKASEKYWMNNLFKDGSMSDDYAKYLADNYGDKISFTDPSAPGGLGGGGTGSGGGGGGGSGSGGKEREQKAYEDEIERYHYLLKTIDAVNKKYDELENAREKAYGTDEIEIMDQEIENLQQQIGLQKQYLDAISQDYLSDKAAIAAYGAQFDENGNIINYEEIYRRQIDLVNSAAGDDEAADKAYEQFKKVLEQYEKTNELLQDTKLSYQELLDKAAELNLEKITVSVEYNVAISDRDRKYLEWLADNMGDSIDKTADKIANLSKQMETYVQDAQTYGEGINAILDQVGEAGLLEKIINQDLTKEQFKELGLTTQQIKQIEDYKDKLMETQQAERELAKTAVEEVTTAFSDWNEEVSDSIDRITSLNDSLEKYRDIIGLLDEDIIGSTKALNDEINAAERQNNLKAIEGQQRKYEQAQQNFERLNALYKDAQDKDNQVAIDALKDSVKEAEEAVIQAHQDMLEATSNALDALEKQWEASMERISKEFAKNMTGLNDISYFKDMYDRQKEMSDWYLDDYEKYYNLNKLVTQINKDLGDNSSLVVSSKLNGLLGKINGSLAEGAQISEATVGYYQKELELIEAQMALESARNAKSVVRMVRDNEGNMSYVYTADSDAIESAEENYQEKWYNLMQYTTEQQDELQEKMISSMEDFIDRAVEAAEKFGIGTEAFNRELGNIQQDFTDLFDYLAGEMDNADGMFSHLQNNWWKELEEGLQKTVALEPDFKTTFGKTILGQLLGTEDTEDWINLMNSGTNKALSQIYDNGQTYVQNQDAVLQAANSSLESVIDDTSIGVSENQEMANEEMQKLDETLTNGEKVLGDAADSLKAFGDKWNGQMTAMTATTDALVNSLNNYFNALSKINDISSSSNPFDFSTMVPSFEQELEEMKDMPYSQLDLSEISSQLVSAPSMISDVSTSGLTALLSLVPSGELDQNVQINATFPNVVNHREIELALNNLILSASQYANRK